MQNEHGNIKEERPENLGDLKVSEVYDTAAGMRAVIDSMKETFADAGVVHGTELLKNLNQKGGIDCNSCAWADPDDDRTLAEFCESGAKAIADEATTKRVTPEFFAKYTVEEFSQQSDQWLNAQGRITHPMILRENAKKYKPISWEEAFEDFGRRIKFARFARRSRFLYFGQNFERNGVYVSAFCPAIRHE